MTGGYGHSGRPPRLITCPVPGKSDPFCPCTYAPSTRRVGCYRGGGGNCGEGVIMWKRKRQIDSRKRFASLFQCFVFRERDVSLLLRVSLCLSVSVLSDSLKILFHCWWYRFKFFFSVVSVLDVVAAMFLIVNRLIRHLFCCTLLSREGNRSLPYLFVIGSSSIQCRLHCFTLKTTPSEVVPDFLL